MTDSFPVSTTQNVQPGTFCSAPPTHTSRPHLHRLPSCHVCERDYPRLFQASQVGKIWWACACARGRRTPWDCACVRRGGDGVVQDAAAGGFKGHVSVIVIFLDIHDVTTDWVIGMIPSHSAFFSFFGLHVQTLIGGIHTARAQTYTSTSLFFFLLLHARFPHYEDIPPFFH